VRPIKRMVIVNLGQRGGSHLVVGIGRRTAGGREAHPHRVVHRGEAPTSVEGDRRRQIESIDCEDEMRLRGPPLIIDV